jgi:hypothetical protein
MASMRELKPAIHHLTALAEALEREPELVRELLPLGIDSAVLIDCACAMIAELRRQK